MFKRWSPGRPAGLTGARVLRVLPCVLIALLLAASVGFAQPPQTVRVRGTITVFRGRNYLQLDWAAVKRE